MTELITQFTSFISENMDMLSSVGVLMLLVLAILFVCEEAQKEVDCTCEKAKQDEKEIDKNKKNE